MFAWLLPRVDPASPQMHSPVVRCHVSLQHDLEHAGQTSRRTQTSELTVFTLAARVSRVGEPKL